MSVPQRWKAPPVAGLPLCAARHYRVAAINSEGRGAWSNTASATTRQETAGDWDLRLVNANGTVIAANGNADADNPIEGRLKIFHDGRWGTVCDDRFDSAANNAPAQACKFMGYDTGAYASGWGQPNRSLSSQPIWLDDVLCLEGSTHWTDSEPQNLTQCYHAGVNPNTLHNCTHREDAGVRCWNENTSAQIAADPAVVTTTAWGGDANDDGRWNAGESVEVKVTFDKAVTVDTENGTPTVGLLLGTEPAAAEYTAGSGTEVLTFAFPVVQRPRICAGGAQQCAFLPQLRGALGNRRPYRDRKGEILTLRWSDYREGRLFLRDAKTGPRTVWLSGLARNVLDALEPDRRWVFPAPRSGGPRCATWLDRFWHGARAEAGLREVRLHDLRHTHANHPVMNGVPVPVVARLLGHGNVYMTLRYIHLGDRDIQDAAERVGRSIANLMDL